MSPVPLMSEPTKMVGVAPTHSVHFTARHEVKKVNPVAREPIQAENRNT